jgi:hypothetical protein
MKAILTMILIYCLAITSVFGQASNPSDTYKIGKGSSSSDKGLIFDTNDGVSNKKLIIEKASKKLKFDGNNFQIGDGSGASDKTLSINGASKSLKYNGTSGEFEFDDTLKLSNDLKTNTISPASGTETNFPQDARVTDQLFIGGSTNQIRTSGGNLEFSNDGSLFKKIGSGSGSGGSGGTQILANDSFEDGLTPGWTSSGGTFSQQTYSNGTEGDTKYARFIASGSGQYFESTAVAVPSNFSGGCQADFKKYNTATASAFKVEAMDTTGATIYAVQTLAAGSFIKVPTISFVCPAAGTLIKIRVTSLLAGTIEVDKAYLGSNQNIVSVSTVMERVLFKKQAAFSSVINTVTTIPLDESSDSIRYPLASGCFTIKVAGKYNLRIKGDISANGETINYGYTINGGSLITSATQHTMDVNGSTSWSMFEDNFQNTFASGNVICPKYNYTSATIRSFKLFEVELTQIEPSPQEQAISPEQASWFVDVNIGGANPTFSTVRTSYTELTASSWDMIINTSKGSASAEIPCQATTASTGLTCSGVDESMGVAFTPPMIGRYRVCASGSFNLASSADLIYQLVETPNNAQTVLQEGGSRLSYSTGAVAVVNSTTICGEFNFSDVSKRTIRLMHEKENTGVVTVLADRSGTAGQRDFHFTVENITFGQNRPFLSGDQVTVPGATSAKHYSGKVSASGLFSNIKGTLFSSCTNANPRVCTISAAGVDGTLMNCVCSSSLNGAGTGTSCVVDNYVTNQIGFKTFNNNAANAHDFNYSCDY